MNRREFFKWSGKVTAAMAALWAVAPIENTKELKKSITTTYNLDDYAEALDCCPYYAVGGVSCQESPDDWTKNPAYWFIDK